jgi:hypothetical protein
MKHLPIMNTADAKRIALVTISATALAIDLAALFPSFWQRGEVKFTLLNVTSGVTMYAGLSDSGVATIDATTAPSNGAAASAVTTGFPLLAGVPVEGSNKAQDGFYQYLQVDGSGAGVLAIMVSEESDYVKKNGATV